MTYLLEYNHSFTYTQLVQNFEQQIREGLTLTGFLTAMQWHQERKLKDEQLIATKIIGKFPRKYTVY